MIFAAPSSRGISTRSMGTISSSRRSTARNAMRVFAGRTGGTGKFSMMVSTIAFAASARRVTNECSRIDPKNTVLHVVLASDTLETYNFKPADYRRSMFRVLIAVLAVVVSAFSVNAQASSPVSCRVVRGQLFLTNGTPSVRIAVTGTRRILGVIQQDQTINQLPVSPALLKRLLNQKPNEDLAIYGDFNVCAITKSVPGVMQMVRVKSASGLVVKPRT